MWNIWNLCENKIEISFLEQHIDNITSTLLDFFFVLLFFHLFGWTGDEFLLIIGFVFFFKHIFILILLNILDISCSSSVVLGVCFHFSDRHFIFFFSSFCFHFFQNYFYFSILEKRVNLL